MSRSAEDVAAGAEKGNASRTTQLRLDINRDFMRILALLVEASAMDPPPTATGRGTAHKMIKTYDDLARVVRERDEFKEIRELITGEKLRKRLPGICQTIASQDWTPPSGQSPEDCTKAQQLARALLQAEANKEQKHTEVCVINLLYHSHSDPRRHHSKTSSKICANALARSGQ